MTINLRIGEIVIEGITLTRREREQIGATLQQELVRRLGQRGTSEPGAPRREGSALGLRIAHEVLAALPAGTFPGAGPPVARLDPIAQASCTPGGPVTTFPGSPKLVRGGLVQLNPVTSTIVGVIVFQYNPDTVTRTLQPRAMTGEPGDRLEVLRLTGPPKETIKLDAELDAADQLQSPSDAASAPVVANGLLPALACLEGLITPSADQLVATDALFDQGMLEIAPVEAPLVVLVWSVKRVVPVLVSSLSITEEAFDSYLRPIRAKASLELKVLTINDLPNTHPGATLYLGYRRTAEQLAALVSSTDVRPLGLEHLP